MSDEFDNDNGGDDAPEHIKKLRADAEKGRKLESLLAEKERQIAFLQAGVDTSTKLGAMLMKTYDGELSSEAIKAEASDLGMFGEQEVQDSGPSERELRYQQARDNLSGGSVADTPDLEPRSAVDRAFAEWNDSRKSGYSNADATDLAFAAFISSAAQGDPSALFNDSEWRAKAASFGHG